MNSCFLFIFSLDASACNVSLTVTDARQYFVTEGYPEEYKINQDCYFNFEAPVGRRILVFFEHFDVEYFFDFLQFRELYYTLIIQYKLPHITSFFKHTQNQACCSYGFDPKIIVTGQHVPHTHVLSDIRIYFQTSLH